MKILEFDYIDAKNEKTHRRTAIINEPTDNYLTYFPHIMFHSFLTGFDEEQDDKKIRRDVTKIEKKVIEGIYKKDNRARMLYFKQREVASEWIYTKTSIIDEICLELAGEYELEYKGYDDDFNKTILDDYNEHLPEAIFIGKIIFT